VRRPGVSVVIPFYNAEAYLAEAVHSALAQGAPPLEVLLVDDGSTDGSPALAARLAAGRPAVRRLRLPSNQGPAAARNAALRAARGGLVAFLDADDVMLPDRLAVQTAYLAAHPAVDVVVAGAEYSPEPGTAWPGWLRARLGAAPSIHHDPMTMLAARAVFDRVGLFDPSLRAGEDTEWLLRAGAAGAVIARLDRPVIRRRIHPASLTGRPGAGPAAEARRIVLAFARARIRARRGPGG
jgi:glycosyltransferase involved in cell wall biosynthesis